MLFKIINRILFICKVTLIKVVYMGHVELGKNVHGRGGFNVIIDEDGILQIGDGCFFNSNCSINVKSKVEIGNDTIIGEHVYIYDHDHKYGDRTRLVKDQGFSKSPIIIGRNCWIGSNVTILKGVHIGDNCVIGAGCIIHNDIPDNTLVYLNTNVVLKRKELNSHEF